MPASVSSCRLHLVPSSPPQPSAWQSQHHPPRPALSTAPLSVQPAPWPPPRSPTTTRPCTTCCFRPRTAARSRKPATRHQPPLPAPARSPSTALCTRPRRRHRTHQGWCHPRAALPSAAHASTAAAARRRALGVPQSATLPRRQRCSCWLRQPRPAPTSCAGHRRVRLACCALESSATRRCCPQRGTGLGAWFPCLSPRNWASWSPTWRRRHSPCPRAQLALRNASYYCAWRCEA